VIGGDDDVGRGGEAEIVERLAKLGEVVVGVLDAGHRSRPVDPWRDRVEAVAVVVLAAVGIARPEHQHERLVACLQHRQHDLGGGVGHIGLLRDVCHRGAGLLGIAYVAVITARRCRERQIGLGQGVLHFIRQGDADLGAGGVVDHDGVLAAIGVIEDQGRAELADGGRAESLFPRHLQDGLFVQVVAAEVLVDIAEHGVVFEEGDDGVAGRYRTVASVDRVAEVAGIAEVVAGRHR
jgi:hypothetical protein